MSAAEEIPSVLHWSSELGRKLSAQRTRMRGAVDAQRERLRELEAALDQRFATIRTNIEQATQAVESRDTLSAAKLAELKREEERLGQRNAELLKHRAELETLRAGLEETHHTATTRELGLLEELSRQMTEIRQREAALSKLKQEVHSIQHEAEAMKRVGAERQSLLRESEQELENREEELRGLEAALYQKQLELEARQERTRRQRVSLARELRARRKELLAEWEHQRRLLDAEIASHEASCAKLPSVDSRDELDAALQTEKANLAIRTAEMQAQLMVAQNQFAAEHRTRMQLEAELREAREQEKAPPAIAPIAAESTASDAADLRRRLEMALTELREEKKKNNELKEQSARGQAIAAKAAVVVNNSLDWETRKQNLLAQLESDYSDHNPQEKVEKLSIQKVIQQTDETLAMKDAELQALRLELAEQTSNVGRLNLGAAALSELLDKDERILQERENLRALQEKVREQFKQAEVEISLERARLARERLEMEEKIQRLEKQKSQLPVHPKPNTSEKPASDKPTSGNTTLGGRWLARLGLKENEK